MTVLAHGIGTPTDPPLPTGPAAAAAVAALVISFAVLCLAWRRARRTRQGRELPLLARLDRPGTRTVARSAALAVLAWLVVEGLTGPDDLSANAAPWVFYVLFWVGLVPVSLLFGPVLRVANPLRLLHELLAALLRIDPVEGVRPLPAGIGYWPAVASLAAFGWLELAAPGRTTPAVVAWWVIGYAAVHVTVALVVGARWFDRGDGFEVYSTLLGALAPVGRRDDGRLALRNPLDGLEAVRPAPGLAAVLVLLIGVTACDGLMGTRWWSTIVTPGVVTSTLALAAATLAVGVVTLGGAWLISGARAADGTRPGPAAFATTLVPIAAGYAMAHYFSMLVLDGQRALILAGDPFGWGEVDPGVVAPAVVLVVQWAAVVVGHLVATIGAHDRAVRLYPGRLALRTQQPMLGAMVALTGAAVGLLWAS
ncbi:hypothetical protein [Pseudonocardia sp.]|uniref:hypothetical protein n=1 Tax=Pseudonocardia sp. TaxID=60912 RepID=UPI003D140418